MKKESFFLTACLLMVLIIPINSHSETHIVTVNQTISGIAKAKGYTFLDLLKANGLSEDDLIHPDDKIEYVTMEEVIQAEPFWVNTEKQLEGASVELMNFVRAALTVVQAAKQDFSSKNRTAAHFYVLYPAIMLHEKMLALPPPIETEEKNGIAMTSVGSNQQF